MCCRCQADLFSEPLLSDCLTPTAQLRTGTKKSRARGQVSIAKCRRPKFKVPSLFVMATENARVLAHQPEAGQSQLRECASDGFPSQVSTLAAHYVSMRNLRLSNNLQEPSPCSVRMPNRSFEMAIRYLYTVFSVSRDTHICY